MDQTENNKDNESTNYKTEQPDVVGFAPVFVAGLVILITLVLLLLWKKRRSARRDVILTGLCESGKTLTFAQLIHSEFKQTHTSISVNIDDYSTNKGTLRVVDIPGQERLRGRIFDEYKATARGIVFMIDSVTLQKEIRDVAEFLYSVLSDPVVKSNSPPVLILCNKQDLTLAKGCAVIKTLLEKELNLVRMTKTNQLQSVDPGVADNIFLGKEGKDFEFAHLSQNIEIAESSAVGEDENPCKLEELTKWIAKVA